MQILNILPHIVPYLNPSNDIDQLYNESIVRTRYPVESSYGVLIRRFPMLSRLKLETTQAVVVDCYFLHNLACGNNDLEPPELLNMDLLVNDNLNFRNEHELKEGNARKKLTEEYFSFLN